MLRLFKHNKPNIALFIFLLAFFAALINLNIISVYKNFDRGDYFNILTINSILAGFLFTGLGVLLSSLDRKSTARLEAGGYLDKYYLAIYIAIFFNMLGIVSSIVVIFNTFPLIDIYLTYVVQLATIAGVIFFIKSMNGLRKIINKMRNS